MDTWFSTGLQAWYLRHKRDLPWRNESDPYKIWLSEIILQQTQVNQGLAYYHRFSELFPTVKHLARAKEDQVLKCWQGLGYYSRARNLHHSAKQITSELKGVFPETFEEIRQLKGVGDYTAAAIASFAFNEPHAVVDGNVYRLLSRIFGIDLPIDSSKGKKEFQVLASQLLDKKNSARHNQSIMEFGSQFCRQNKPDCESCIFKSRCYAFKHQKVDSLPVKNKKKESAERHFNYILLLDANKNVLVRKRKDKDIWAGLYEFVLIESKKQAGEKQIMQSDLVSSSGNATLLARSEQYKHTLSHQNIHARFYVVSVKKFRVPSGHIMIPFSKITLYPLPRLITRYLESGHVKEIL